MECSEPGTGTQLRVSSLVQQGPPASLPPISIWKLLYLLELSRQPWSLLCDLQYSWENQIIGRICLPSLG